MVLLIGLAITTILISCSGENPVNPPASGDDIELTGRWEAEPTVQGLVEYYWLEFRDDGSMQYGEKGANEIIGDKIYDGTYSLQGHMITITLPTYPMQHLQNATAEYEITSDGHFWFPNKNDGSWGSIQNFDKFMKVNPSNPSNPSTPEEPGAEQNTVNLIIDGYHFPDGENNKSVQVSHGSSFEEMQIPETGLIFEDNSTWGWYEEGSDVPFTGNIDSDMTLYLKWTGGVTAEIDGIRTYLVKDPDGLYAWRDAVMNEPALSCILLADIALPVESIDSSNWESPFNDSTNHFSGMFDGEGHTISNIQNLDSGRGLIGAIAEDGIVQNLSIENSTIMGLAYTAGIASYNNGTIRNCSFSGFVQSTFHTGGIVGENKRLVYGCKVDAELSMENESAYTGGSLGGIVADNFGGKIIGCSASGNIISNAKYTKDYIGGIVGSTENGYVVACVSDATVGFSSKHNGSVNAGTYTYTAGIAGGVSKSSEIRSCRFTGEIERPGYGGGSYLVGWINGSTLCNSIWSGGSTYTSSVYDATIKNNGMVPNKYSWKEATEILNTGIIEWNNSNPDYLCNFEFVQQSILSMPDLIATN